MWRVSLRAREVEDLPTIAAPKGGWVPPRDFLPPGAVQTDAPARTHARAKNNRRIRLDARWALKRFCRRICFAQCKLQGLRCGSGCIYALGVGKLLLHAFKNAFWNLQGNAMGRQSSEPTPDYILLFLNSISFFGKCDSMHNEATSCFGEAQPSV